MNVSLLINVKMRIIFGIFIFIVMINFMLSGVLPRGQKKKKKKKKKKSPGFETYIG